MIKATVFYRTLEEELYHFLKFLLLFRNSNLELFLNSVYLYEAPTGEQDKQQGREERRRALPDCRTTRLSCPMTAVPPGTQTSLDNLIFPATERAAVRSLMQACKHCFKISVLPGTRLTCHHNKLHVCGQQSSSQFFATGDSPGAPSVCEENKTRRS